MPCVRTNYWFVRIYRVEFFSYPKMVSMFLRISKPISPRIRSRRTYTQRGREAHSVRSLISTCVAPSNRREKGGEKIHTLECQGKRGICASIRIGRGGGPGCVRGGDIFLLLPWKKRALVRPASLLCLGGKTLPVLCSTHCRRVR